MKLKYKIVKWENLVLSLTLIPMMLYAAFMVLYLMWVNDDGILLMLFVGAMFAAMTKIVAPIVVMIWNDGIVRQ